jgi:DUF1365 family protein
MAVKHPQPCPSPREWEGFSSTSGSSFYVGEVRHVRLRPRVHRLRYRVFMTLIDLDRIAEEARRLRTFAIGPFALMSFRPRDHGDGGAVPLKVQVETLLARADLAPDGGPIALLCMPRILGFVFNPLSVYFCRRRDGTLFAIVYEVSSTFGQRCSYVLPVRDTGAAVRQGCEKRLHVSPFMDMDLTYDFRIAPPAESVGVVINTSDQDGLMLHAAFKGARRPLTDLQVLRLAATMPFLTLKVVAAIHWEALRIWLKGVTLRPAPKAAPPMASYAGADRTQVDLPRG